MPLLSIRNVSLPQFVCQSLAAAIALSIVSIGSEAIAQGIYSVGSEGCAVEAIQRSLGVSADGIFGEETEAAVIDFQTRNGLSVDGIVGSQTLAFLGLNDIEQRCGGIAASFGTSYSSSTGTFVATGSTAFCDRTRPYVVAIPGRSRLSRVQRYFTEARVESSRLGSFVCAGSFTRRSEAEQRSNYLQSQRLDARVEYRP